MQCPKKIKFDEKCVNPKQGGTLEASFTDKDLPATIQVKGTQDSAPVTAVRQEATVGGHGGHNQGHNQGHDDYNHGHNHGHNNGHNNGHGDCHDDDVTGKWESKNKYTSLKQTLQLIKNGNVVLEGNYDVNGNLASVVTPTPPTTTTPPVVTNDTQISNYAVTYPGGVVLVNWLSLKESNLKQYVLSRKVATTYDLVTTQAPKGLNINYALQDSPADSGTYFYQLKAVYLDNTELILAEQSIDI